MSTPAVPAIFVSLTDPRVFPSDDLLEKERLEAREKQLIPVRPILYTTVDSDATPVHAGCKGKCDFANCECLYFAGKDGGVCSRCTHANLYHRVKIRRIDLEAKAAADALKAMKHRRHIPTQREIDEQKLVEENKAPEPVNTYPCDVMDCECKKMSQPPGWDPTLNLPKLCRGCRHAEIYHVYRSKADKNRNKSSGSSSGAGKKGSQTAKGKDTKGGKAAAGKGGKADKSASAKKAKKSKKK